MKISICIPQYNRSEILLQSLYRIEKQTYKDLEIVISDDGSTDDTIEQVTKLKVGYKYPIRLHVNPKNEGFDRNYRKSIELASGDYALVIGNDDTLNAIDDIQYLVDFLRQNDYPDIGYCNYIEYTFPDKIVEKVMDTGTKGSGIHTALQYYSGFSFIGGIIYKKSAFDRYNTSKHDGSIFSQMYLGLLMVASGCEFFTLYRPLIVKNIEDAKGGKAWSYIQDGLPRGWAEYRVLDAGLPAISQVLASAIQDSGNTNDTGIIFKILSRIYIVNFPYWIVQYKASGSLAAAVGLIRGMRPQRNSLMKQITLKMRAIILLEYYIMSIVAIIMPIKIFSILEDKLRRAIKSI